MINESQPRATHDELPHSSTESGSGSQALFQGLAYLQLVLQRRLKCHFDPEAAPFSYPPAPEWIAENSPFYQFLTEWQPEFREWMVLMIALAPQVYPQFFDTEIARYLPNGGDFPEIGGIKGQQHRGMLPTGDTVLFVLAGQNFSERLMIQQWLRMTSGSPSEGQFTRSITVLEAPKPGDPIMSGRLAMDPELVEWLLWGEVSMPRLSSEFPAQHLSSSLSWDDLVLDPDTRLKIQDLGDWLVHGPTLMEQWGMKHLIKPGYRALFHGPPGTGKTLAATLLGKYANRAVFRIDLSMVVSKYIGETEKNLSSLFDKAAHKEWILFFDEADSLFGKRTNVRDAHDKYANQEVSYLLQRMENYPGLVILASNFKGNIDEAFLRRFQSVVFFPMPKADERFALWLNLIPKEVTLSSDLDLRSIAQQFELTGSNILNIVQHTCIRLLSKNTCHLDRPTLLESIRHEFAKEDKLMNDRQLRKGK